ncbi:Target of rapamycin complex 2 subunit MAPKAP1-like [Oopsacas minuta]|uniref:Target of rapamycin complex 2 subunit MAPKAP1-like n=1 Tax=Oopsacas minuta TaxID=111878 RepID=A0AAV7JGI6_9METZ|nr:Target of rapamycin complex 2 subunit MAPKAP1-like [Oopsacas minuta]
MAFWDNEARLVQHICHSFVISDDTGYADRIFIDDEDSIEETDQGYHINQRSLTGLGIMWIKHTHSITKKEMDQTIKDIENAAKWRPKNSEKIVKLVNDMIPLNDLSLQFPKKVVFHHNPSLSLLSKQISQLSIEELPFFEYSKFNAINSNDRRSLSVTIIFDACKTFVDVTANINTRIFDLIGLSLYLYHKGDLGLPIDGSVGDFKLYIADENGDIDRDFPSLSPTDYLKKFRFSHLGLVRVECPPEKSNPECDKQCVVIFYKLGDYPIEEKTITMPRPAIDIQMIEVLSLAIRKKGLVPCDSYILSEYNDCFNPISHFSLLSDFKHNNFWLLKQDRSNELEVLSNTTDTHVYFDSTIPHAFEHYEAVWLNKKGEPITQILISEIQITFKPLILDSKQLHKSKFRIHPTLPKTEVIARNSILRCDTLVRQASTSGRKSFYILAMKGNEKKMYEFEADNGIVSTIIEILSNNAKNHPKNF